MRVAFVFVWAFLGFFLFEFGSALAEPAFDELLEIVDTKEDTTWRTWAVKRSVPLLVTCPVLIPLIVIGVVFTVLGGVCFLAADTLWWRWTERWPTLAPCGYLDPHELHHV